MSQSIVGPYLVVDGEGLPPVPVGEQREPDAGAPRRRRRVPRLPPPQLPPPLPVGLVGGALLAAPPLLGAGVQDLTKKVSIQAGNIKFLLLLNYTG